MSSPLMNIYLISLKDNIKRRDVLAKRFHKSFPDFNVIDAVDGKALDAKTYFSSLSKYYLRTKKIITPSELGCTLSHIKALENFLASNASHALIFEDDVIGSDELLRQAELLIDNIPENAVLLLGCQDGLRSTRWHYGKCLPGTSMYKLSKFSYTHVYRSCAYIVTKKTARIILDRLKHITLADEWSYLSKSDIDLFFVKLFNHPIDIKDSAIESERVLFNRCLWISRLWNLEFYIRNIMGILHVFIALISGHRKI